MANSGVGSQAGGAKETTWGTAVTPTKFWEYESESLNLDHNYYDGAGLVAGRTFAPSSRGKKTTRSAGGDLAMTFPYKGGGFFLDQMVAGTITPVQQGATAAYLSTFNVGSSVPNKSATLQINKPQTSGGDIPFTYPGGVLVSAAFSLAVGGALMATFTWLAKDETTPTTTPAGAALATATYVSSNDVWVHQDMTLTYGGAAVAGITGVNWTWSQPYADGRFFLDGSGTISKPVPNGIGTVTGTLSGEWYDSTFYAAFRSGAYASLVCTAQGPTAIASTYFPMFRNTFSAIQVRGTSPTVSGPDLLDLSVPFVVKDDGTNPPWKAEYQSTDLAAW
jgi:hypothetical protein